MYSKIVIGEKITAASISGAYSDWMKQRQNKQPSNLDNPDYYHKAEELLSFMRFELGVTAIEP